MKENKERETHEKAKMAQMAEGGGDKGSADSGADYGRHRSGRRQHNGRELDGGRGNCGSRGAAQPPDEPRRTSGGEK